jgi:cell fate regulator YaaT (PSP1 superfamily)
MGGRDSYDDLEDADLAEEDIALLEDNPAEDVMESASLIIPSGENREPLTPDTPVYRLRLSYSNETFKAIYEGEPLAAGSMALVPTRYGRDLAQVIGRVQQNGPRFLSEVARIERPASKEDLEKAAYNREQEEAAYTVCRERITMNRLDMKLVSVHFLLEESKILFFFTAENRIDFRDLVKDLVNIFKSRIELRQIGVRDECRVIGGLGVCGRCYCCHAVSDKLKPVSIKMAKDQNLSLNSMKISGPCGRLLCCLAYEHGFYAEQRRFVPPEGCKVNYDGGLWKVMEVNVAAGTIKLSHEDGRVLLMPASQFEKSDGHWQTCSCAAKKP